MFDETRLTWIAISVCAFGWGTSGVAARAALESGVGPLWLAAARSIGAAVIMVVVLRVTRRSLIDRTLVVVGALMAVLNVIAPYILLNLALGYASSGFVYLVLAMTPLSVAVLAHFFLRDEPLRTRKLWALLVGFAGVAVLIASGDSGLGVRGNPTLAAVFSGGAVLALSSSNVVYRRLGPKLDSIEVTTMTFVLGTPILVLTAAFMESGGVPAVTDAVPIISYLAIVGSVVPYLFLYWLLRSVGTGLASTVGYVAPLITAVAGAVVLGEQITPGIAAGAVLILLGAMLINRSAALVPEGMIE
jgi:drug/metabolite transporter (DMT)-like permease